MCRSRRGVVLGGALLTLLAPSAACADVIVDDSWADGGRDNGPDPLDSNWWTSSSPNGIEVAVGSLGLVSGTSGRGIHTVFPTQTLADIGDKLVVTYTFTTPATVGSNQSAAFRVGLFDTLGRAGLNADVVASSGSPNSLYGYHVTNTRGLPGYMMDMDLQTGTEDLNFRHHNTAVNEGAGTPTGLLMLTTTGFSNISPSGPDGEYFIVPNTTYTGSISLTRASATEMQVTGSLGNADHTVTDVFDSADVDMLAFWAVSNAFGSSNQPNTPDNGIDFSNVTIEFIPVQQPGDINNDGVVGPADLAELLAQWGPCVDCAADLTGDGVVGPADLAQLLAAWST
jgi:hypothetical protein